MLAQQRRAELAPLLFGCLYRELCGKAAEQARLYESEAIVRIAHATHQFRQRNFLKKSQHFGAQRRAELAPLLFGSSISRVLWKSSRASSALRERSDRAHSTRYTPVPAT